MNKLFTAMCLVFFVCTAFNALSPYQASSFSTYLDGLKEAEMEREGKEEFDNAVKNYDALDKTAWKEFTKDLTNITLVNEKINSIPYLSDRINYNKPGYWAAPQEMIAKNAGDCEDYALAKYFALQELGFDEKTLKILVVDVPSQHAAHAILLINDSYVLNNGIPQMYPISVYIKMGYYVPLFTVNKEGVEKYVQQ